MYAARAMLRAGVRWSIKRDDTSGLELSGNKVRKLEFLMAEALAGGHDCVVTCGGAFCHDGSLPMGSYPNPYSHPKSGPWP